MFYFNPISFSYSWQWLFFLILSGWAIYLIGKAYSLVKVVTMLQKFHSLHKDFNQITLCHKFDSHMINDNKFYLSYSIHISSYSSSSIFVVSLFFILFLPPFSPSVNRPVPFYYPLGYPFCSSTVFVFSIFCAFSFTSVASRSYQSY